MISGQAEVRIRKLSPELADDYFSLFDDVYDNDPWLKYEGNRDWGGCYCTFYDDIRADKEIDPSKDKRTENRANRRSTIENRKASGLLAYVGGRVVGWCNVAPRGSYANPQYLKEAADVPEEKVGSVTCLTVLSKHRKQGVGTQLLKAACDLVEDWGIPVVEGYPRNPMIKENSYRIPAENPAFRGSVDMFLTSGFKVHRDLGRFLVVRKKL